MYGETLPADIQKYSKVVKIGNELNGLYIIVLEYRFRDAILTLNNALTHTKYYKKKVHLL